MLQLLPLEAGGSIVRTWYGFFTSGFVGTNKPNCFGETIYTHHFNYYSFSPSIHVLPVPLFFLYKFRNNFSKLFFIKI